MKHQKHNRGRSGQLLILMAFFLPMLLGMTGLVIDGGLMMASHRQAQNAADGAAVAAAQCLLRKQAGIAGDCVATAKAYLLANGLSAHPDNKFNTPPTSGYYAGNTRYAEVIVHYRMSTLFLPALAVLGIAVDANPVVQARAVAGYESFEADEHWDPDRRGPLAVVVLNRDAHPGLQIAGGSKLTVQHPAGVAVYSLHAGNTHFPGESVSFPGFTQQYAATSVDNQSVKANFINVSGGVDVPANFLDQLKAGSGYPPFDPYLNSTYALPTPTIANGVTEVYWDLQRVTIDKVKTLKWVPSLTAPNNDVDISITSSDLALMPNQTLTVPPGIYGSISVSGGGSGTVQFGWDAETKNSVMALDPARVQPNNIYVIKGGATNDVKFTASEVTIEGTNVMFYNTGSDFNPATGAPDNADGLAVPNPPCQTKFGGININSQHVHLSPIADGNSPFDNILFYQRRWNTQPLTIQSNGENKLVGVVYARNALFKLSGGGQYNTQVVAGNLQVSGQIELIVPPLGSGSGANSGGKKGMLQEIFLVE